MATRKSYIGSGKEYVRYTNEQLAEIRRTDMIDFLGRKEGFTFKRAGNYFKCIEHNSLVIYPNRQMWVWNSQNLKGLNCLDWLQKVNGYSFQEACAQMIHLSSYEKTSFIKTDVKKPKENVKLDIPARTEGNYKNVFMYLTKSRHIEESIVTYCFHNNIIYQDTMSNAIFVGYDENNNIRFAEKHGTNTYLPHTFRGNTAGTDMAYSFSISCDKTLPDADVHRLYVFEAPIDLLSHCTMTQISDKVKNGEKSDPDCWKKQNRLSLSGTSDVALAAYLKRNPEITEIDCCLDNDAAGIKAANIIKEKYSDRYKVVIHRVKNFKDYNEALQNYCRAVSLQKNNSGENIARESDVSYNTNSVKR